MEKSKVNPEDYVWVITENQEEQETIVGLTSPEGGNFIPVTTSREDGMAVMSRLPPGEGGQRRVEAIHKKLLLEHATRDNFQVLMVNGQGEVVGPLQGSSLQ